MNTPNPFKSRKFAFALAGLIAALVMMLVPNVPGIAPETVEMARYLLPRVLLGTALLISGHFGMDFLTVWKGAQLLHPAEAWGDLLEAVPLGELTPEVLEKRLEV